MSRSCDGLHVVQLTSVIIDPPNHDSGQLISHFLDGAKDIISAQKVLSFSGSNFNQILIWVASMKTNLTAQRVAVAWKSLGLAQQFTSLTSRLIEANEQQMEIDGQAVHRDDFGGLCPCEVAKTFDKSIMVADPWILALEMAINPQLRPVIHFNVKRFFGRLGLKPEAVACEVDGITAFVLWKVESLSKFAKWVREIQFAGRIKGGKLSHAGLISH